MPEGEEPKRRRTPPPRVRITYDVETGEAIEKRELPFVVGVLGNLSNHTERPLPPLKERKFVTIDADNFDSVMARMAPRAQFKVDYRLVDDWTKLNIDLRFTQMRDFEPEAVAMQVSPLRRLLEHRRRLLDLRSALAGNRRLEEMLQDLAQPDKLERVAAELGSTRSSEEREL